MHAVVFSPDGSRVASSATNGVIDVWDAATGAGLARLRGHEGPVSCVAFSPDATRLASGSSDLDTRRGRRGQNRVG